MKKKISFLSINFFFLHKSYFLHTFKLLIFFYSGASIWVRKILRLIIFLSLQQTDYENIFVENLLSWSFSTYFLYNGQNWILELNKSVFRISIKL